MPVSDVLSLFARTAADASITAITVGACVAVMAMKDDSVAAPDEFAIVSIPDAATRIPRDSRAPRPFAIGSSAATGEYAVALIPPVATPVARESQAPKPFAVGSTAATGEFAVASIRAVAMPVARESLAPVVSYTVEPLPPPVQDVTEGSLDPAPLSPPRLASLAPEQIIVAAGPAMTGLASMYNPNDPHDRDAGKAETASGQLYDADAWTAAIQVELRAQFGGVRFGKAYQPAFALVQTDDKQAIIRINDVGPLLPGRIIDLNERAMRYFDPSLHRGLLNIRVTPLVGTDWVAGPLPDALPINIASR